MSGRYRMTGTRAEIELRVDVDGQRPLRRVSGDVFSATAGAREYFGSFEVAAPAIADTAEGITLDGAGSFTWAAAATTVRVTIARTEPRAPAIVTFVTPSGEPGATYVCAFESPHFRTVTLEQDFVAGTEPFETYETGSLPVPPDCPPRTLSVSAAYVEAGVEIVMGGVRGAIAGTRAAIGGTAAWSDSELHVAMVNHFSSLSSGPRWQAWLLVATEHEKGRQRGVMFDAGGEFPRQGAAVFAARLGGFDAASRRGQLRTYVHELGHIFNLLHSWEKDRADPPRPLGPNHGLGELSWMNYPGMYEAAGQDRTGEAAFWADFAFQFTDDELAHLRHGRYRSVVMGADNLGQNSADADPGLFDEPVSGGVDVALELRAKETFAYGEPVFAQLTLRRCEPGATNTHACLDPKDGLVTIAVRQPSGRAVRYRPFMPRCVDGGSSLVLDERTPAYHDSAFIGYGRDGFYFQSPGEYLVRAHYVGDDRTGATSPVVRLRVRAPATPVDERVGELMMGSEQGRLLYLLGSDARSLRAGNDALDELLEAHPAHPLAVYVRMLKGVNAGRDFKQLTSDQQVLVRPARAAESVELLTQVADASRAAAAAGVDDLTLNDVMQRLAGAHARAGDLEHANAVLDDMVDVFDSRGFAPHVMTSIRRQAGDAKATIAASTQ